MRSKLKFFSNGLHQLEEVLCCLCVSLIGSTTLFLEKSIAIRVVPPLKSLSLTTMISMQEMTGERPPAVEDLTESETLSNSPSGMVL